MYYPLDPAKMIRTEWGSEAPAERQVEAPKRHPVRRVYARLWWAVRPRAFPAIAPSPGRAATHGT